MILYITTLPSLVPEIFVLWSAKYALLELLPCLHTTVIKDMCADCGEDLSRAENKIKSDASIPMVHAIPDLKVTQKVAMELGQADTKRLLHEKKLVLLVDLDQTLIHTTNDNVPVDLYDVYHYQLYGPNSSWYHTKLRPGIKNFLMQVSLFYELHICTFGARNYAHKIAKILDKNGSLFSHRILSRDECLNISCKIDNLKSLFPCGDSMVCIIDDREDVWNMAPNLIQVKPYHYFQHTGDINAPPELAKHELDGKGIRFTDLLLPSNHVDGEFQSFSRNDKINSNKNQKYNVNTKEDTGYIKADNNLNAIHPEDSDDYLMYLQTILMNIHKAFYRIYNIEKQIPDLKLLIPKLRAQVLRDRNIVFSGLIPNNLKLEQSRAFMVAKSLGANVSQHISDETTHLVAVSVGTFKVNAARKNRYIRIVTPDWLWCCAERWECVDESIYPLNPHKPSKMRQPPPHCHSPEHFANYAERLEISPDELKFVDTLNPLLSFSNADLVAMNQEIEQIFEQNSSSEEDCQLSHDTSLEIDKQLKGNDK